MLSTIAWGIGALETVCLQGQEQSQLGDVGHIPSMLFCGVRQKEAVWLRMADFTRIIANGLDDVWKQKNPMSLKVMMEFVNGLPVYRIVTGKDLFPLGAL